MTDGRTDFDFVIWRPEQYQGGSSMAVVATQLADKGVTKRSDQRAILDSWMTFFRGRPEKVRHVAFRSRVPQELLASLEDNIQLESLSVKWGSYSDLSSLSGMTRLKSLSLGGASKVTDLSPIAHLTSLESLAIDGAFAVRDLSPLSSLTGLRELMFGSAYPGTDKTIGVSDLEWLRPLTHLTKLAMPGSRLAAADLSVIAELPRLSRLSLPLRRNYRKEVMELSVSNSPFAEVAREYEDYEAARGRLRSASS